MEEEVAGNVMVCPSVRARSVCRHKHNSFHSLSPWDLRSSLCVPAEHVWAKLSVGPFSADYLCVCACVPVCVHACIVRVCVVEVYERTTVLRC